MDEPKDKPPGSIFRKLALKRAEKAQPEKPEPEFLPAMPELGTAPCPVCGHRVAVFVTRTKRPFINCGYCSARIFYNGSRSMQLLQEQIRATEEADEKSSTRALKSLKNITGGNK